MPFSQKKLAFSFNILLLIPALVKMVEALHGPGNGAVKKQAVLSVAGALLSVGGAAVAANNPTYSDAIGQVIDFTVQSLNASGQMPAAAPDTAAPAPLPHVP
jgi:hypothetical protein